MAVSYLAVDTETAGLVYRPSLVEREDTIRFNTPMKVPTKDIERVATPTYGYSDRTASTAMTVGIDTSNSTASTTSLRAVAERYLYQPMNQRTMLNLTNELYTVSNTTPATINYFGGTSGTVDVQFNNCTFINTNYYNNNAVFDSNGIWSTLENDTDSMDDGAYQRRVKRQRLRQNLVTTWRRRSDPVRAESQQEAIAQETLREVVTEDQFKKYLRYGFVLVPGKSGAHYQVFRNNHHVKVWVGGRVVEEICVYLMADSEGHLAPPTDKVVAFKAMIEADEEAFKNMGNRYRNLAVAA